jgi:hypothetical protein
MVNSTTSLVTIYRLPWSPDSHKFREDWFQDRHEVFHYRSDLEGEKAAEEAFHITNAPDECLTDDHKAIIAMNDFKGPSLSVGDVVRVKRSTADNALPDYYLCKSFGWEKYEGNVIKLLKLFSW